jgi:hypothetical protein
MTGQIKLDLSYRPHNGLSDPGKKTERITFTATDDLTEMLRMLASKLGTTVSEYCHTRVIECASRDIGEILLIQAKANKPLKDLLR